MDTHNETRQSNRNPQNKQITSAFRSTTNYRRVKDRHVRWADAVSKQPSRKRTESMAQLCMYGGQFADAYAVLSVKLSLIVHLGANNLNDESRSRGAKTRNGGVLAD